jgi:hypothetical protein
MTASSALMWPIGFLALAPDRLVRGAKRMPKASGSMSGMAISVADVPREAWSAWFGEEPASTAKLQALLKPFPADAMRVYPVSTKVNV